MFTGIIQATGKIVSSKKSQLVVLVPFPTKGIKIGESIAVDGCCLTVVKCVGKKIVFDVSSETFKKTTIGSYQSGQIVNLERAMRPSDRFGGHFVTGHVDGVGVIRKISGITLSPALSPRGRGGPKGRSPKAGRGGLEIEISFPKSLSRYLIDKGSVTVDGISLTVCRPTNKGAASGALTFIVHIVPHTKKVTNLSQKRKGDPVNLEMDILGKYVQALISRRG